MKRTHKTQKDLHDSPKNCSASTRKKKNIQEPVEKKDLARVEIVLCGSAKKRWIVLLNGKPKNIEIWTQQAF